MTTRERAVEQLVEVRQHLKQCHIVLSGLPSISDASSALRALRAAAGTAGQSLVMYELERLEQRLDEVIRALKV